MDTKKIIDYGALAIGGFLLLKTRNKLLGALLAGYGAWCLMKGSGSVPSLSGGPDLAGVNDTGGVYTT